MAKEVNKTEFVQDVQNGMSKADIATKYEIPPSVAAKFASACNVKFKRQVEAKYVLVDTTCETEGNPILEPEGYQAGN